MFMIIVNSPAKCGSSYLAKLLQEVVEAAGFRDTRATLEEYGLSAPLVGHADVDNWTAEIAGKFMIPVLEGKPLVLKTHQCRMPPFERMLLHPNVHMVLLSRDPRDCAVSARDAGVNNRKMGGNGEPFDNIFTIRDAIEFTNQYLSVFRDWIDDNTVFHARYEDLVSEPASLIRNIFEITKNYACLRSSLIEGVVANLKQQIADEANVELRQRIRFNAGTVGRYASEFSDEDTLFGERVFGDVLDRMKDSDSVVSRWVTRSTGGQLNVGEVQALKEELNHQKIYTESIEAQVDRLQDTNTTYLRRILELELMTMTVGRPSGE